MFLNSLGVTAHALGSSPHIALRHHSTPSGIRGYIRPFHATCRVFHWYTGQNIPRIYIGCDPTWFGQVHVGEPSEIPQAAENGYMDYWRVLCAIYLDQSGASMMTVSGGDRWHTRAVLSVQASPITAWPLDIEPTRMH